MESIKHSARTSQRKPGRIPFDDYGGSGRTLVFLHANGYPPDCYQALLQQLAADFHVVAMHLRPLWPGSRPEELESWLPLTDDLQRFLEELRSDAVFTVGHSLGAIVALRAAMRQRERILAAVLIEPVLFPPTSIVMNRLARHLGLKQRIQPKILAALRRRRQFDDLESAFRGYRTRPVFQYMTDESLRTYLGGITKPSDGAGYELIYSPEWEARIYATGVWRDLDLWRGLKRLATPCLFVRGAESDTFRESAARLVQKRRPDLGVATVPHATHLVPLERPREVSEISRSFLMEKLGWNAHLPN